MTGAHGSEPGDDSALAREIALAQPDDELDAKVAAIAFLRERGTEVARVDLGGYELERSLGGGGFGRVYLATQPGLGRRVAVKLLHRHRGTPGAEWLRREASALAQLSHPNVVQIYQVGEAADRTFIVMEYVEGETLRAWQADRAWAEVLAAYEQAALGLAAAHARGILHLDFKPSNALVARDGRVIVVDFGLAGGPGVSSSASMHSGAPSERGPTSALHTRPGGGTEGYASPEQAGGAHVDARSDQFSFCVALYEALHGVLPFTAAEIAEMSTRPDAAWVPRRGDRRPPRWLDRAIRRGLSVRPERRWPTMRALLEALAPRPWPRRVRSLWLVAAIATAIPVAFVALRGSADESCTAIARELAPAWDTRRRDAVEIAIVEGGAPYHVELSHSVLERLDLHARSSLDVALAVCASTRDDQADSEAQAEQRRCLRRDRDRFDRVVDLILGGGPATSEHGDALVAELGDPRECERATEAPASPTVRDDLRASEVAADLDLVRLDVVAGRLEDANERAERTVALALQVGDAALLAEARLVRGLARDASGRDDEALVDLDDSGLAALAIGRDDLAAESWRRAAWIAGNDLGDLPRADRWSRLARAALQRLGEPARASAEQLDTEGMLLRAAGDAVGAEAKHRAALLQLELAIEPDDPRWIGTWRMLAHALADRGATSEAAALYERALGLASTRLGALHPQIAALLLSRALIARDRAARDGDPAALQAADADLRRAAEIMTAGPGGNPPLLAAIRTLHAQVALLLGRLDDAEALASEAWAFQRDHLPRRHPERASALAVLARVDLARSDWNAALERHLAHASELSADADPQAIAEVENNIGWLLCRLERCAEARRHYQRALDKGDAGMRVYAAAGLGHVALALDDPSDARARLEAALEAANALPDGPPADLVAEIEWHLAEARLAAGEPAARVRPLVESALELYRASGSDAHAVRTLEALRGHRSKRE